MRRIQRMVDRQESLGKHPDCEPAQRETAEAEIIPPPEPAPVHISDTVVVRPRPPDVELKPERVFATGEWKDAWR
jgi:hypothetical protein